jgi:hypothetical protein
LKQYLLSLMIAIGTVQVAPSRFEGSIQGTVIRADTGESIPDVQISVVPLGNVTSGATALFATLPPGYQLTPSLSDAVNSVSRDPTPAKSTQSTDPVVNRIGPFGAASDSKGRFTVSNLPPGLYTITARKDGYVAPAGNLPGAVIVTTTPIAVVEGNPSPEIALTLLPGGIIGGRVRDPGGMPMSGITVVAYQYAYVEGGRVILTSRNSNTTDDRGDFRLFWLPTGDYVIAAVPKSPGVSPNPQDNMARTFVPGTVDATSAMVIRVKAGDQIEGLNVDVRAANAVKISGRVVNSIPGGDGPVSTQFYLVPRDMNRYVDSTPHFYPNSAIDKSKGQFEIRNVDPGSYELIARIPDGTGRMVPGRTIIEVGTGDVQGVTINIHSGVPVKVRIVNQGGSLLSDGVTLRPLIRAKEIYAAPFDGSGDPIRVTDENLSSLVNANIISVGGPSISVPAGPTTDATGVTTIPSVAEARYTFRVNGLPTGAYISDIRTGDSSIFDSGLIVGSDPPNEVQIIVSLTDTTVEGTVLTSTQTPAAFAKVVIVPEQARRENTSLYRTASANATGQFTVHGVVPGRYKLFAWDDAPLNYAWQNAEFIARVEQRGVEVTVLPSGVANLRVLSIP